MKLEPWLSGIITEANRARQPVDSALNRNTELYNSYRHPFTVDDSNF